MKITMLRFTALLFIAIAARQVFDISKAGWLSQPRVETKAPELYAEWWAPATNAFKFDWTNLYTPTQHERTSRYSLAVKEITHDGGYFPLIVQLRTYAKTNGEHAWIGGPPVFFDENGIGTQNAVAIYHPATTNLVTVHVLGYFSGTNAVELIEVEKPQTK